VRAGPDAWCLGKSGAFDDHDVTSMSSVTPTRPGSESLPNVQDRLGARDGLQPERQKDAAPNQSSLLLGSGMTSCDPDFRLGLVRATGAERRIAVR
jgi:hypothetical protein